MFDSALDPTTSAATQPHPRTAGPIGPAQLLEKAGSGSRLIAPDAAGNPALISGLFSITHLREGLHLHCTDIEHLQDMTTRCTTPEGGVKVMLKLEGNADVRFGGTALHLDAGQGRSARPCAAVLNLSSPEDFERRARGGTRERMVVLTLSSAWIAASGLNPRGFGKHLSIARWQPSARAIAVAEQLIRLDLCGGQLQSLYQESRALELIGEALFGTRHGTVAILPASALRPAEHQRMTRLQKSLESGEFDHLGMDDIARAAGCNANTLQRQFRQTFGKPIFDYRRECRLQRAADALQRQDISVAQAAEIAGYNSQANFSTAFRRHFGVPPKHFRTRL